MCFQDFPRESLTSSGNQLYIYTLKGSIDGQTIEQRTKRPQSHASPITCPLLT